MRPFLSVVLKLPFELHTNANSAGTICSQIILSLYLKYPFCARNENAASTNFLFPNEHFSFENTIACQNFYYRCSEWEGCKHNSIFHWQFSKVVSSVLFVYLRILRDGTYTNKFILKGAPLNKLRVLCRALWCSVEVLIVVYA